MRRTWLVALLGICVVHPASADHFDRLIEVDDWSAYGLPPYSEGAACYVSSNDVHSPDFAVNVDRGRPGEIFIQMSSIPRARVPSVVTMDILFSDGMKFQFPAKDIAPGGPNGPVWLDARIPYDLLPPWLHSFTAGSSMKVVIPMTPFPAWTYSLKGTSTAIGAMAQCITNLGIKGLPKPFDKIGSSP